MSIKILDGWGTGVEGRIDPEGRLFTLGVAEPPILHAALIGDAYILQSPKITLTTANPSAVLYIKNDDPSRLLVCDELRTFLGESDSPGDVELICYSNPTGGTLLSAGTANYPKNRNLGQTVPAQVTALTGVEGQTLTGGSEIIAAIAQDRVSPGVELYFGVPNGSSIGITVTPPAGNTSMSMRIRLSFYFDTTHA